MEPKWKGSVSTGKDEITWCLVVMAVLLQFCNFFGAASNYNLQMNFKLWSLFLKLETRAKVCSMQSKLQPLVVFLKVESKTGYWCMRFVGGGSGEGRWGKQGDAGEGTEWGWVHRARVSGVRGLSLGGWRAWPHWLSSGGGIYMCVCVPTFMYVCMCMYMYTLVCTREDTYGAT